MAETLNDFLSTDEPAAEPDPVVIAEPVVEPVVEPVAVEKVEEEPQPGARVPVAAIQAIRGERNDWKEKATRAEGELSAIRPQLDELKELKAQLAELQKAQIAPSPPSAQYTQAAERQPFPPPPNAAEDPVGFAKWQREYDFNERVNDGEEALRADPTIKDVDEKIAIFKEAARNQPLLAKAARAQPDPFRWAYDQATKIVADRQIAAQRDAMLSEIGTDPEAYKAKLRAEWEAERAQAPSIPEVVLPQSLAGARNAGARTVVEQAVPEFDDIFKRKPR